MGTRAVLTAFATGDEVVVAVIVALLAFAAADGWRRWALRRGVLDVPGHRSSHAVATPRGAGVGIVVAVAAGVLWLVPAAGDRSAVLLSILLAGVIGLADDLRPLSPPLKLAGQIVAALPVAVVLPLPMSALGMEALAVATPAWFAHAIALAVVLLYVNAWNFMDGIDGIACAATIAVGTSVLMAGAGAVSVVGGLAVALVASSLGFLPVNLRKSKAFMGDCGSHALGMGVATLVLAATSSGVMYAALAASAAFVVDVLGTLVLRALDGEPLATAHRRHLYQLVTRSGYSHVRVTTAYAAWMLASGGSVVMMMRSGAGGGAGVAAVFAVTGVLWFALGRRYSRALRSEVAR